MLAEKGCQMKLAKAGTRKRKGLFSPPAGFSGIPNPFDCISNHQHEPVASKPDIPSLRDSAIVQTSSRPLHISRTNNIRKTPCARAWGFVVYSVVSCFKPIQNTAASSRDPAASHSQGFMEEDFAAVSAPLS